MRPPACRALLTVLLLSPILLSPPPGISQSSVVTYHYDNARTGLNGQEQFLTPANVNQNQFRRLFFQPVDGQIYGQPLYMSNVSIPGKGTHNVVFVTTQGDSVYAFDADDNQGANASYLWHADLLRDPAYGAAAGATTVPQESQPEGIWCTDISPQIGITSTSVIDPDKGVIYLVAKTEEVVSGKTHYLQRLHALAITNGTEISGSPVVIGDTMLGGTLQCAATDPYINNTPISIPGTGDGSASSTIQFNALRQLQRVGLLLQNGILYVASGSHCDCLPFHGWVLAYDASTLALLKAFNSTPNGSDGGIWMEGSGLAADKNGNIFCATGNGTFDATHQNFGDSFLKLDPHTLAVQDYFTPFNQNQMDSGDLDLGSGGVVLVPDNAGPHPHLLTQVGKLGIVYVVDRDQMTTGNQHYCPTCTNDQNVIVQELPSGPNSVNGTSVPATWNGTVYFRGDSDVLKAFPLNNSQLSTPPLQTSDNYGGRTTISAKEDRNGIVWSLNTSASMEALHAYDAVNLSPLYSSDSLSTRDGAGGAVPWASPMDVNGRVYVGAADRVSVYGLFGIGGYDLESAADRSFAFDYDGSGKRDYLVLYRPGTGSIWILKNNAGNFTPVFEQADPGSGIGGYDLKSPADRAFAFDYSRSGKLNYLVLYRPGTGLISIVRNIMGRFAPVYQGSSGIGGYDLQSAADRVLAFDYDSSGKPDHLVLYRPGTGMISILKNDAGTFTSVYQGSSGIGGYDLKSSADHIVAFDYEGSGKLDHLFLYRPGSGTVTILKNNAGTFSAVYQGTGIGGYDLKSSADRVLPFDYDATGKLDHLVLYRPGDGTIWILKNSAGTFAPVYQGGGIGGYKMTSADDDALVLDYDSSGRFDHLVLYRPGTSKISILQNSAGVFAPNFAAWEHTP